MAKLSAYAKQTARRNKRSSGALVVERVLYPAVDKRAATGSNPFTASIRAPDRRQVDGRARHDGVIDDSGRDGVCAPADNLPGLISAHIEEEEEVLLPILDRTMSKEEFDHEISAHGE